VPFLRGALEIGQHFFGVAFRLHIVKDLGDLAVRPYHKGRARDPFHFLAIHVLLFDHAESFTDLLIDIGQQGVRQAVLILEFLLGLRRVSRDPKDYGAGLVQLAVCVTEPGRLNGSARRIGFGKKEQYDGLAAKIFQ
jgi:hypothetical protein